MFGKVFRSFHITRSLRFVSIYCLVKARCCAVHVYWICVAHHVMLYYYYWKVACQACKMLFQISNRVYFLKAFSLEFLCCLPLRSTYYLPPVWVCLYECAQYFIRRTLCTTPHSGLFVFRFLFYFVEEKKYKKTIELVLFAYKLIDYDWCDRTCWMSRENIRITLTHKHKHTHDRKYRFENWYEFASFHAILSECRVR